MIHPKKCELDFDIHLFVKANYMGTCGNFKKTNDFFKLIE
jgi:hypothetical protein